VSSNPIVDAAVVVPTFNRLNLLRETVDSLRNQTLTSVRFVMVDDRSDTETRDYLRSLATEDQRFVFIEKSDGDAKGCQVSRNIGLDACDAHAVVFLDSDDLLASRALEERFRLLSQSPQAGMVVGPQAIFTPDSNVSRWVNIPQPGTDDIDRFLEITHPIDVPWVNGGVMIRTVALRAANVRWRPEFDWDDVAFHFECLVSGLVPEWMTFDGGPDSWYRMHPGPRYGNALSTQRGILTTAKMIAWMYRSLDRRRLLTDARKSSLVRGLYRACVLPSIDAGDAEQAREIVTTAQREGVLSAKESKNLLTYVSGRRTVSFSDRATFFWNRFSDRRLLASFIDDRPSTYGSVAVNQPPQAIN